VIQGYHYRTCDQEYVCDYCGATVEANAADVHDDWHDFLELRIERATSHRRPRALVVAEHRPDR
jgi:hypothetical protein